MVSLLVVDLGDGIGEVKNHDYISIVESLRDSIIFQNDKEGETIKKIINFQEHKYPHLLYSQPRVGDTKFKIYSLGDKGRGALNSIFVNLVKEGGISILGKMLPLKGTPKIFDDVEFLPAYMGKELIYSTKNPIFIFSKKTQPVFQAIAGKHFRDGFYLEKATKEELEAFNKDIQVFVNEQIRESIKYYLKYLFERDNEDGFEFVDEIDINWIDFKIIFAKYHSEEKPLPVIVGKFKSNYRLPKFIGYKTGKGFGELGRGGVK